MSAIDDGQSDVTFDLRKWIPEFRVDDSNRATLCFREALIVALKDGSANDVEPVGEHCIQVEPVGPGGRNFLVHAHSSITVDGNFSGTRLVGTITEGLRCLEEKHTESFVHEPEGLREKSLLMGLMENAYHVEITRVCPCNVSALTEAKDLDLRQYENFIGEGTSVLLMRYLAMVNHVGVLRLHNVTMDGGVATSDYTCRALRVIELNGRQQKVYTIEREIHEECCVTQRVKSYLTSQGRILMHDWLDTPYIAQTNLLYTQERSEIVDMQIPLRGRWMQDIEMFSKYLDAKFSNAAQYTDYLVDHPEIKQLIADYVQTLLVVKPVDVIDFTIQHFKSFAREPKVWDTDSFAKQSDTDTNSQLSKDESDFVCGFCGNCIKCRIISQFDKTLPE